MSVRPEKTYSPSVALDSRGGRWSWRATRAPAGGRACRSRASSSPASTRSSVDLPAPLRPESVIRSRGSSLKETSSNSSLPPTWTSREVAVAIAMRSARCTRIRGFAGDAGAAATPRGAGEGAGDAALDASAPTARRWPSWRRGRLALPAGLEVEWLGVSGYRLSYEGQDALRRPLPLAGPASASLLLRRPTLPDPAALDRFVTAPGRGRRRARRPHPLRPRGRRAGDRPPLRLQGLRLGLAGRR